MIDGSTCYQKHGGSDLQRVSVLDYAKTVGGNLVQDEILSLARILICCRYRASDAAKLENVIVATQLVGGKIQNQ